jgi:hypothetical protein
MNLPRTSFPPFRSLLTASLLLAASGLFAAPDAPKEPAEKGSKAAMKTYTGSLKTGIMAIGAETTGVTLTTADGVYELDLKNPKLKAAAEELNGKQVNVEGIYKPRPGVEIKERRIIDVKSLTAAN